MTTHTTEKTLLGRTALITGGSRGIGAATALRLAREGADVAVTYVNGKEAAEDVVRAVEAQGRRAVALRADARRPGGGRLGGDRGRPGTGPPGRAGEQRGRRRARPAGVLSLPTSTGCSR